MTTTFGTRCAALLVAMNLPFEMVVRSLMSELDLSYDEASAAAREVGASGPAAY